jgi:hypothetical protein
MQGAQAQHYRIHAARLRELACATRNLVARHRLISLAMRFEELADDLEGSTATEGGRGGHWWSVALFAASAGYGVLW